MGKRFKGAQQMKALIYCRVSSDRQVAEGHGLDSQELRCKMRAKEKGYQVAKCFRDEGISGKFLERDGIQSLLGYLDDHPREKYIVIIDDLSRLARDVMVHLRLRLELKKREAELECLNMNLDETDEGELVELMMAGVNQYQRKSNRRQVINKMKARLEAGFWPFCMPPGLKNFKDPLRGKILKPDGSPDAIVRKTAIEKYANGELRTQDEVRLFIKEELEKLGVDAKLISYHGVQNLLKNPLYYSLIEYKPWNIPMSRGKHNGLVDPELYPVVLSKFNSKPRIKLRKDYTSDFPLRGLVRCAKCGGPFTGSWSTGRHRKKYPKYTCSQLGCPMRWKTIHRDKIHALLLEQLKEVKPSSGLVDLAISVLNDVWTQHISSYQAKIIERKTNLELLDSEIENWTTRIGKTHDEELINYYENQLKDKLSKKNALEGEKFDRQYSAEELGTATRIVFKTLEDPVGMWQSPDGYVRRTIVLMYFEDKLYFDRENGFGTASLSIPIKLMQDLSTQKFPSVEMPGLSPGPKS